MASYDRPPRTPVACRAAANGTLLIRWPDGAIDRLGGHGVRLLVLLLRVYGGAMPRHTLIAVFCDVPVRQTLTISQHATFNRLLSRLQALSLIKEAPGDILALTLPGVHLGQWLTRTWDGWAAYATILGLDEYE